MKQFRLLLLLLLAVVLLTACGNKQMSPAEMQQKLDSIARLETIEQLEMQGVHNGGVLIQTKRKKSRWILLLSAQSRTTPLQEGKC